MKERTLSDHDKELIAKISRDNKALHIEKDRMRAIYVQLSRYIKPSRSGWSFETQTDDDFGKYIFDGEAISDKNRMADGLFGQMVSPSIDWLNFAPRDDKAKEDPEVQKYAHALKLHMMDTFSKSNFYDAVAEGLDDGTVFGTVVTIVSDNKEEKKPVFETLHLREILISENRFGHVDLLHREFEMSFRQMIEEFGEDILTAEELKKAKDNMEKKVRVLHATYPRSYPGDTDNAVQIDINKPIASIYLFCGESIEGTDDQKPQFILREGGFDYQHFSAWRFKKYAGMTYGGSPSMDALFDVKMMNMQAKTMADVAQLAARPPMEATLSMKGNIRIAPGGITYKTGDQEIRPVMTTISYPLGIDSMERRSKILKEHFKADYFMSMAQMQGSRDRTATEIMEMKAQSAAVMGPMVGRIQSEYLEPLIMTSMKIELAAGRLPELPEGMDPSIIMAMEFVGPLAQAQKKYLVKQGIEQGLQAAFGVAQGDPSTILNFDLNYAARELVRVAGFPPEGIVSPEEAKKRQQAQAEAQEKAKQEQLEIERAKATPAAGTAPDPGSPLGNKMGVKQVSSGNNQLRK